MATMSQPLDSQQVEVLGRAALTAALAADNIEVARAERDAGIDLIAFTVGPWRSVPIQMKAATTAAFNIDRKYERIAPLVMVYVWNCGKLATAEFFAMAWSEALAIGDRLGYTRTASWNEKGRYSVSSPGADLRAALAPHRVTTGGWGGALFAG